MAAGPVGQGIGADCLGGKSLDTVRRLPRPIRSVTSLTIDGLLVAASDYAIDAERGKITLRSRTFSDGLQNVEVQLSAGYDFLDIWPQRLMQTISGPEEELQKLKDSWEAPLQSLQVQTPDEALLEIYRKMRPGEARNPPGTIAWRCVTSLTG